MLTYSNNIMNTLRKLNEVVDMADHRHDLDLMTETNYKQELKKKGPRSKKLVEENTARGLGAEILLQSTGFFEASSPIIENAEGLTFAQRKRDLLAEGIPAEVKTMSARYPIWYMSEKQRDSISYSTKHSKLFIVVAVTEMNELTYKYRPRFVVDSSKIMNYIVPNRGGYSPWKFDHQHAIASGDCIDLWR